MILNFSQTYWLFSWDELLEIYENIEMMNKQKVVLVKYKGKKKNRNVSTHIQVQISFPWYKESKH